MNRFIGGFVLAATALCASLPAMASGPAQPAMPSFQNERTATPTFRQAILQVQAVQEQDQFPDDFSDVGRERQMERGMATTMFALLMLVMIIAVAGYAIPIIIAFARGHAYRWPITAVTILGGWTGFGWVAALIWSLLPADGTLSKDQMTDSRWRKDDRRDDGLDRIVRLADLRDRGIISEEEFSTAKAEILARA